MSRRYMENCSFCNARLRREDNFCPDCGKEIKRSRSSLAGAPPPEPSYKPPERYPRQTYYQKGAQRYHLQSMVAPAQCSDRITAFFIDYCIVGCTINCVTLGGCGQFYLYFKDGYDQGRSLGKKHVGIRVINYQTGMPATYMESCARNICKCPPTVYCNSEYRGLGDLIAGTMVIQDR